MYGSTVPTLPCVAGDGQRDGFLTGEEWRALEAAGREQDALAWFHRTHAIDSQELTDAAERAEALEKRLA